MTTPTPHGAPELLPCPFCHSTDVSIYPPTCSKSTPYNPADRAFPVARCKGCGASKDGRDWDQSGKSAIAAWNRRAAIQQAAVAEGWKLVPVMPTAQMLSDSGPMANYDLHARHASPDADHVEWYRAMLAASPVPPKLQPTGAAWAVQIMQDYKPHRLRLTIGVQSFDIDVDDTEEGRMEWFCEMLTKAMKNATATKQQPALGSGECGGVPQWQPIETAPMYVDVLACNPCGFVGRSYKDSKGRWNHIGNPTHWMTLPPAPTGQINPDSAGQGMEGGV